MNKGKLIYFSSIDGNEYFPYLISWLESLTSVSGEDDKIVIFYSDIDQFLIKIVKETYSNVSFLKKKIDSSYKYLSRNQKVPLKLKSWIKFLNQNEEDSQIIFLDIDLVFKQRPDFFQKNDNSDLFLTLREGRWPLNTGVIGVRVNQNIKNLFKLWLLETQKLVQNIKVLEKGLKESGGGSQHTLIKILGRENLIFDNISNKLSNNIDIGNNKTLKVKLLNCNEFNCDKPDQNPNAKIIHYKGGWHDVFLSKGNYSKYRKFKDSFKGFALIETAYNKGIIKMQNQILEKLSNEEYSAILNPIILEDGGIYYSEMAYFCFMVDFANCDVIIESGTRRGYSTEILAKQFNKKNIISIDFEQNEDTTYAKSRLSKYKNLSLIKGNAFQLLPKLLKNNKGKRIALLIDGPKGLNAVKLVKKTVSNNSDIKIVAIHDMKKLNKLRPSSARANFQEEFDFLFFTDSEILIEKSIDLDKDIKKYQEDFTKDGFYQESYGPTLGIAIPTSRDRYTEKNNNLIQKIKYKLRKDIIKRFF